jgi:GTP-binding protein
MIPVIAILGRPNVGKSTLFNCLTKSRDALVADLPGVTRDRKYGEGEFEGITYIVIDTGGIETDSSDTPEIFALMSKQSAQAIREADILLFVVDAKQGLMPDDYQIADQLRQTTKPTFLVVNKSENMDEEVAKADFFSLGFQHVNAIASAHNRGVKKLLATLLPLIKTQELAEEIPAEESGIKIAVVGRPNVGKSTLINRVIGEERVLVYDEPGTTRDSIYVPFRRQEKPYTLIDTAGVRRRTKITDAVEKFSVIKTLQSIEASQVVIFVLDARQGISDQDLRLLDFVIEAGKALVIAVNKWDNLSIEQRNNIKKEIDRRLGFVLFARCHFISALHGTGVGDLFKSIEEAYSSATKKISTSKLTQLLTQAVAQHQPPVVHNHRIKLRLAHMGGSNPPIIVIHGNQTESVPQDYLRYLTQFFRKALKIIGTPIRIELKSGENPFKGKRNILTPHQQKQRQRMLTHQRKKRK